MTDDQFRRWLISQLRRISYRFPAIYEAVKKARVGRGQYKCKACGKLCGTGEYHRDHRIPVVDPKAGFVDWNTYIDRLFVRIPGGAIDILCIPCHAAKTEAEGVIRRPRRKK